MPQVLALDVACQRDQMRVRITFDSPFNGVVYSKGYYGNPQCSYVAPGSSRSEYEFVVVSGTCGTRYVENPGTPSYLENTVVIQNEPGIQEVWDTARGVRCVFEGAGGDSTQRVSAALSVAMLDQQVVSFAADSQASASLDIQIGRGPFAPSASGMVKIGELMTMVVAVEGPASADVLVRQCVAHDGSRQNPYQLTDENGCVLGSKKKILGSWQKSRDTGNPKIPVVTFSHFQAFKFPDKNDVYIECQVDLCSNGCPICPEDGSRGRRRRAVPAARPEPPPPGTLGEAAERVEAQLFRERGAKGGARAVANGLAKNESAGAPVRVARRLRVLSPEDISVGRRRVLDRHPRHQERRRRPRGRVHERGDLRGRPRGHAGGAGPVVGGDGGAVPARAHHPVGGVHVPARLLLPRLQHRLRQDVVSHGAGGGETIVDQSKIKMCKFGLYLQTF
nr:uncharacterized protein LOC113819007 [Penaeus vannamei]